MEINWLARPKDLRTKAVNLAVEYKPNLETAGATTDYTQQQNSEKLTMHSIHLNQMC